MEHWLTVKMPAYLDWFSRNWKAVFRDLWEFTKTVFTNLAKNFWDLGKAIVNWFSSGFTEWDFTWTPLLEGFQKSMEELPKIADREMTPFEKKLKDRVGRLGREIADEYHRKVAERLARLEGGGKQPGKETAAGGAGGKGPAALMLPKIELGDRTIEKIAGRQQQRQIAAIEARFLTRAGKHADPAWQTAKNTEEMNRRAAVVVKNLSKLWDATKDMLREMRQAATVRMSNLLGT